MCDIVADAGISDEARKHAAAWLHQLERCLFNRRLELEAIYRERRRTSVPFAIGGPTATVADPRRSEATGSGHPRAPDEFRMSRSG